MKKVWYIHTMDCCAATDKKISYINDLGFLHGTVKWKYQDAEICAYSHIFVNNFKKK